MTTGCKKCDKEQERTGRKWAMCPSCEIRYLQYGIGIDKERIRELKEIVKG